MNLPKFKEYLAIKLIPLLFEKPIQVEVAKSYTRDFSFVVLPQYDYEGYDKPIVKEAYSAVQKMNSIGITITDDMVLNTPFALEFKFEPRMFSSHGISYRALNKLSETLKTDEIYISGDGCDYQLGEYTSDHDSEVILVTSPGNKVTLLDEYHIWFKNWQITNASKGKSIRPSGTNNKN